MEKSYHSPAEVVKLNMEGSVGKSLLPLGRMILMGIMAGAFIAIGGAASNTAAHTITDVGLARTLTGLVFPVGLMMIVFVGGELFTGNCLMFMGVLNGQVTLGNCIRNLFVVYFSNMAGALGIDLLLMASGNLNYSNGLLGAYTIKIGVAKLAITPGAGIASGILCNILVCIAILMAAAAKDVTGKILAILFPIWAFVICGFEHCVANMFYIPMAVMAAKNPHYVQVAMEQYGLTAEQIAGVSWVQGLHNLIPVTIGNIIGGALWVGGMCFLIYQKKWNEH